MANDAAKLQKSIYAHLANDSALIDLLGGIKVYDRPVESASLPYITFGTTRAFNADTASEAAQEHLFTLYVWSRKGGRLEALTLLNIVRASLNNLPVVFDAMRIVSLRFQSEDIAYNEPVAAFQGIIRYRAMTESETL